MEVFAKGSLDRSVLLIRRLLLEVFAKGVLDSISNDIFKL